MSRYPRISEALRWKNSKPCHICGQFPRRWRVVVRVSELREEDVVFYLCDLCKAGITAESLLSHKEKGLVK